MEDVEASVARCGPRVRCPGRLEVLDVGGLVLRPRPASPDPCDHRPSSKWNGNGVNGNGGGPHYQYVNGYPLRLPVEAERDDGNGVRPHYQDVNGYPLRLPVEAERDDAEGRARVRVHRGFVLLLRPVPQAVLGAEGDVVDLGEGAEGARPHLVHEMLNGLRLEVGERAHQTLAEFLAVHAPRVISVVPRDIQVDEQGPVVGVRQGRELVTHEVGERAPAQLDE